MLTGQHHWFLTVSPGLEETLIEGFSPFLSISFLKFIFKLELSTKGYLKNYTQHEGGIELESDFISIQKIALCSSITGIYFIDMIIFQLIFQISFFKR